MAGTTLATYGGSPGHDEPPAERNGGRTRCLNERKASLEAAMAGKQFGQKEGRSGKQKQRQQEANLGQREAHQEKEKESELSQMGEMSDQSDPRRKD
jgi:hypothetical protein